MTDERRTTGELTGIPILWEGDFLCVGKISIGFIGYDLRKSPKHFSAFLGSHDNIIGWFATREAAKQEIVRFITDGPRNSLSEIASQ